MQNEILNEIPTNEQWNIEWNTYQWAIKYLMKCLPMSNEIFNEISAMENDIFDEIPTNEQWNIEWNNCHGERNIESNTCQWTMKYLMK